MPDIGEKIRLAREGKGLSRRTFGEATGLSEAKIQAIEIGKQRIDHISLSNIAKFLGIDTNWLLGLGSGTAVITPLNGHRRAPGLTTIPKLDVRVSAGTGQPSYSEDEVGRYAVKASWLERRGLKPENLKVVTVVGDSMEPDLYDEDRIIIDCSQTELKDSFMYAVRFSGDVFVKRIQRLPDDRALLISKNADYPSMPVDSDMDFKVIGRVVSSMHEW